jgi:putative hydroxymethylpyrimidine transport system ATP-binding protein
MGAATVEVTALTAGYGERARGSAILDGVEFALPAGQRLAVVGQSGCGKSTLLHALAGLLTPWRGSVSVDGRVVRAGDSGLDPRAAGGAGHAAYMFQQDLLLPWKTVLGNAVFAAGVARGPGQSTAERAGRGRRARADVAAEARARTILAEFGLGDVLDALPRDLSGGMRQRVALARTLVLGRGLVLLDEPFGSLDALTRADMRLWLLDAMLEHPASWVLVTHDVHEAVLLGDQVAVLRGRPARLEGWTQVPLSAGARRGLARLEAGGAARGGTSALDREAGPGADDAEAEAAGRVVRELSAQILAQLMARDAA